jgi:polysaccharide deacetylase family protein (PEP-CTERM system associated)
MRNALSIDVEDYWSIFWRDWLALDAQPTDAIVRNTQWFLEVLQEHGVKATFFVLGEVAVAFPGLVRSIATGGHELGTHGMTHRQVFRLSPEEFRQEVRTSKALIQDAASVPVAGYRAPAFSITPATKWALEILAEEGFVYDSSIFPIAGRRYGWPGFSCDVCSLDLPSGRRIIEVPLSVVNIFGRALPVAGGGYLRHFPYWLNKRAISVINRHRPAVVYMHPYEIDTVWREFPLDHLGPEQRVRIARHNRMQFRNRGTMSSKVRRLLSDFEFGPIGGLVESATRV